MLDRQILDRRDFERTEFYQDWARPQGMNTGAFGFFLPDRPAKHRGWGVLMLVRDSRSDVFDQGEQQRLEALLPHVRRAVSAGLQLGSAMSERDALAAALDRLAPRGALLVNAQGRVVFANAAAETLLARSDAPIGRTRDGTLTVSARAPSAVRADLVRLLARAAGKDGQSAEGGTVHIPVENLTARSIVLEVLPFADARPFGSTLVLVMIDRAQEPPQDPPLTIKALQARWDLTPAEARTALLLAKRGTGSKMLARELGVSPTTVRTHLQRVLEKTDTHSRAALVALLLHGPV
ncbi:helix-turn-helix transcriptional regulator [Rubellimicrobium rubrum]|nr:helix-turn-helix transcriptional regulator [Rubellimicrobium rubrum]